jgi:hypothetical protein
MYQCVSFKVRSYIIQCRDGKGVHAYTDQSTESTVLLALGVYNIDGKFGHLIFGSLRKKDSMLSSRRGSWISKAKRDQNNKNVVRIIVL